MSFPFAGRLFNKHKPFFPYEYKDYSFKLDLEFGELYFTKKLISFSGKHLPFNLSLHYIYRHSIAGDDLYIKTGFPRGFKTNYHVFLEYDSAYDGCYKYEDADGFEHIFIKAENTPSNDLLYFDKQGSGLMLKCLSNNSGFQIFDDDGNYQEFDSGGRLVSINKKINDTLYASQHIYYQTDLKISLIVDNYNRAVSFVYTNNSVTISYNNNVIITLSMGSALLTSITKNIGGNHSVIESFTHSTNPSIKLTNIALDSGESFSFTYDDYKILNFVTNIKQDVFSFSYGSDNNYPTASVTNARGIKAYYEYGEKQLCSRTYENNSPLSYSKVNSEITSCLIKTTNDSEEIIDFLFGIDEETWFDVGSYSFGSSQTMTNNHLQAKKMYLLVAEIEGNLGSEHFDLSLYDYDNNLLAKLIFSGLTKVLTAPVGIKASSPKSFSVSYANFTFGLVTIVKVRLLPLIGDFEIICTDINTYGPIFFYENTPYYQFPSGIVDTINNTPAGYMEKSFTATDLLINERLFYKRDNHFHFWANDKKDLFDDATSVFVLLKSNFYIGFDASYGKIALYDTPSNRIADLNLYRLKGTDDNSFSVTKISHDSSSFHTGYTSYYYEEMETKYVAGALSSITYYDYQPYYLLKEVNRHDGYKEEYDYDSHLNLIEKHTSHTNINEQIKNEYNYSSYDELTYDKKLVGSSYIQTNYSYDIFGNVISISYPNQTAKYLNYDNVSGERNLNHSFSANNITITQNNNYISADNRTLSTPSNTYSFTYDNGQLSEVSYNNQNILSISYEATTSSSGFIIYAKEMIDYSNGDSQYIEYDSFDRISIKDTQRYNYDDCSRLSNIIDEHYSYVYPIIIYSYDYYDQICSLENKVNLLKVSFAYDIYRRLTSKTYSLNNNSLYEVSYLYFTKPGLENSVKNSIISNGYLTIETSDGVDDFSRLTSESTIINNQYVFRKDITYCVGGQNNSLTNSMVKSVTYDNYTLQNNKAIGPIIPPVIINEVDNYTYDSVGNITSVIRTMGALPLHQTDYIYDSFSRLIRENNQALNKTIIITYDDEGNITSKSEGPYTTSSNPTGLTQHNYSYYPTYSNKLKSFGTQINDNIYDNVGNPLTYRNKTLTWIRGTLLSQVTDGSNNLICLSYDGFKQRISKSITDINNNTITTSYSYIEGQLLIEQRDDGQIKYLYSNKGVIGFILSGFATSLYLNGTYLYEKNIQQDVIAIRDINNNIKAKYVYDAWGNFKVLNPDGTENTSSTFIGNINPIRYRSYYYDTDLKMYWLTTRYYDPEVGRFISPDHYSYLDYQKLHGLNLYAYSKNNPVMYYDPSGHFVITLVSLICVAAAIGFLLGTITIRELLFDEAENNANLADKDPTISKEDKKEFNGTYSENGVVINYKTSLEYDDQFNILTVYESWRYSKEEIRVFLEWLVSEKGFHSLDVDRVLNEWMWHNIAFSKGIAIESTKNVDAFFDASDKFYWFIFDWMMWWR